MEGGAPPPIETVCAAIETLYHNPDPREKERASNWLQDLQKSVFAWKVSLITSHSLQPLDINNILILIQIKSYLMLHFDLSGCR